MTITHHPDDSTLMAYAAGSLPAALAAVVAAHAELCPRCAQEARRHEAVGGALLHGLRPAQLTRGAPATPARSASLDAPDRRSGSPAVAPGELPRALEAILGGSLDALAWRRLAPGLATVERRFAGPPASALLVIRAAGGATIPDHGHGGSELTLVLSGGYGDATGHYVAGDLADLDAETSHAPVADPEGCVCLVATDGETHFRSPLARLWQKLGG